MVNKQHTGFRYINHKKLQFCRYLYLGSQMKKGFDIKLLRFYLWIGLAYFVIGFLNTWHVYTYRVAASVLNNIWGIIYLLPVNFISLEYVIPFVLRKRRFIITNIIWGVILLFTFM